MEAVFREDLEQNPRNPRSLYGLVESVRAQKQTGANWLQPQFESGVEEHAGEAVAVGPLNYCTCSNAWARRNIPNSSKCFVRICIPTGRPVAVTPAGTLMHGMPARLPVMV